MKKNLMVFAFFVIAAVVFFGCTEPGDEVNKTPGGPSDWVTELGSITVDSVEDSKVAREFSFDATVPAAETYTLYYIEGTFDTDDIEQIVSDGTAVEVDRGTRTVTVEFESNKTYSVVVEAKLKGLVSYSEIKHVSVDYDKWVKTLVDFEIDLGEIGEVTYLFNETEPVADKYTLYYAEGNFSTLADVKAAAGVKSVDTEVSGTITGLKGKTDYSFVVVAKYGDLDDSPSKVETIATDYKWVTEISNFEVILNDEVPTEVEYSFDAASPAADLYTIYYVKGKKDKASDVINAQGVVSETVNADDLGGKIDALDFEADYSFVVVASHPDLEDSVSSVVQIFTKYTKWVREITTFHVQKNINETTENYELVYSFGHTTPRAESYTIYYKEGNSTDVDAIKEGTKLEIGVNNEGIITDFKISTEYSFVVEAKYKEFDASMSNVVSADTKFEDISLTADVNELGEITYSFNRLKKTPLRYSLYCYYGATSVIETIMTAAKISVEPSGTLVSLPGKKKGGDYSLVVVAEYTGSDNKESNTANTSIKWVTTETHFNHHYDSAELEMNYTFRHTTPVADKYFIYYLLTDANAGSAEVKNNGTAVAVTQTSGGKITLPAGNNKIIFTAEYDGLVEQISEVSTVNTMEEANAVIDEINELPLVHTRADIARVVKARAAFEKLGKSKQYVNNEAKLIAAEERIIELEKKIFSAAMGSTKEIDGFTDGTFNSATGFGLTASLKNGFNEDFSSELALDVSVEYTFKGLNVVDGKLTNEVLNFTTTESVDKVDNLYVLDFGSKLGQVTSGKVIVKNADDTKELTFPATRDIERRLYDIANNRAKDYGAVEMFSYGNVPAATVMVFMSGPTTRARGNTIVNYENGKGKNAYFSTFSRGDGGVSGSGNATQIREVYYDGATMFGRSLGGETSMVDGTDIATAVVLPSSSSGWATTTSVNNDTKHKDKWVAFVNNMRPNPFGYIPYDVQGAFSSYYQYRYVDSGGTLGNGDNPTGGRTDSPNGIIETATKGRLSYATVNGTDQFQFTVNMDGNKTKNIVNIEWAGGVNTAANGYVRSYVTFIIDSDMKFVKYHAFDRYEVADVLTVTTNSYATMYFMYHKNNIDFNNHKTYRGHRSRLNTNNYCDCTNCSGHVTSGDNAVIANSAYQVNIGWTASANETSKIAVSPNP